MKKSTLENKQRRFAEEYLKDLNGTQAVIRAGYVVKNNNVAHVIAQRLLQKATVKEFIQSKQRQLSQKTDITVEYYISRLCAIIEDSDSKPNEKTNAMSLLARITGHAGHNASETKPLVIINQIGMDS